MVTNDSEWSNQMVMLLKFRQPFLICFDFPKGVTRLQGRQMRYDTKAITIVTLCPQDGAKFPPISIFDSI